MLSFIIFLPLAGAALIALLRREQEGAIRPMAAIFTLVVFLASLLLFVSYDREAGGFQFVERFGWISISQGSFDVQYFLGVDGLSLPLVVLTAMLGFLAVLISWHIDLRPKEYFAWLLVLETGVLGVFASLDFLLFFLFWEVEIFPMYMLISIWGSGRREYSAIKFVVYTLVGSALMLVGILALYFSVMPHTFDMTELPKASLAAAIIPAPVIFFLLFFAYAVKLPVFPFHTWLPDAHTDAPTAVSVILAGVLLKMGGYAMIRVNASIFPEVLQTYAPLLVALAVINVVYGAIVTIRQSDLKKLIAYSSVSHMGYVLLGIAAFAPISLTGATLQMFTHGTITGLLFTMVGLVYDKTHNRRIPDLGGLAHQMPFVAVIFVVAGLASLGLPSMSGFVAELLVFLGTYPVYSVATLLGVVGILLTAGYILWMLQRVFFGPAQERYEHVEDATRWHEAIPPLVLVASIMLIGLYPAVLVDMIKAAVTPLIGLT